MEGTMDYQTAVLEGCKLYPEQAFHHWFTLSLCKTSHTTLIRACVNGAALAGLIGEAAYSDSAPWNSLKEAFPVLGRKSFCPVCPPEASNRHDRLVSDLTVHLNDTHKWSRERIAQFVADL